jgi:ankyrin repeat protein
MTPLIWAIRAGSASIVRLLLDHGADTEARDKFFGKTPLFWACENPNLDVLRLLLERGAHTEVRCRSCSGATPLAMVSTLSKTGDAARLLIQFSTNVDGGPSDSITPLFCTLDYGNEENVKVLLENKVYIGLNNWARCTALELACIKGLLDTTKLLLKRGIDINHKNEEGVPPLSLACRYKREAVVRFLVEQGADIESRCDAGLTPFRYCMMDYGKVSRSVSIGKFLLDNGADIEARDSDDTSTLAVVAGCGNSEAVGWLLENGADPESQNVYGETPLVRTAMLYMECDQTIWALL